MSSTIVDTSLSSGVMLDSGNYGSSLTITSAGTISGAPTAVEALLGSDLVANDGLLHGSGSGAFMQGGTLENAGEIFGGTLGAYLWAGSLTNAGVIRGEVGVVIRNARMDNSGSIYGSVAGLYSYDNNVTNSGQISGGEAGAILSGEFFTNQSSGTISGNTIGVALTYVSAVNDGVISGGELGLGLEGIHTTLVNYGQITGTTYAAYLQGGPFGPVLVNNGQLNGFSGGVGMLGGTLINSGVVSGINVGVYISAGSYGAQIVDTGTIAAGLGYAIDAVDTLALTLGTGSEISGGVRDRSGNGLLALTGSGSLAGLGGTITGFDTIDFAPGASWTLEGNLAGLAAGQQINGFAQGDTLILDGFVATSESLFQNGLVLSNGAASATLALNDGQYLQNFTLSSQNGDTGIIFGSFNAQISIINTVMFDPVNVGYRYIAPHATVTGTGTLRSFTELARGATLVNYGALEAAAILHYGSDFENHGVVGGYTGMNATLGGTVDNFGVIEGSHYGVNLSYGQMTNSGTVSAGSGAWFAVNVYRSTLVNTGLITAANTALTEVRGQVLNEGEILGGVSIGFDGGTFVNDGLVAAAGSFAVTNSEYSTLLNNGVINGSNVGLYLVGGASVTNDGTIGGQREGISASGADIVDAGLISGSSYAIYNTHDDPQSGFFMTLALHVEAGARFVGAVKDNSGLGVLVLGGSQSGSLDIGSSFSGFSNISFAGGVDWTLEGAADDLAGGETINGFTVGDTIILDGFGAGSYSFVPGSGLVLANPGGSETLHMAGALPTSDFSLTSTSDQTEIHFLGGTPSLITTISTEFHNDITLNAGNYGRQLSITNTGAVLPPAGTAIYGTSVQVTNAGTIGAVNVNDSSVLNLGTILSNVYTDISGGTLTNDGVITGEGLPGIVLYAASGAVLENNGVITGVSTYTYDFGTIINTGTISNSGEALSGEFGSLFNSGLISGTTDAVYFEYSESITNSGTIVGNIATSELMYLTVLPGAVFEGTVINHRDEGLAGGQLDLAGNAAGNAAGSLDMGGSFIGFSDITFSAGSNWLLAGTSAALAAGQTLSGFTLGDTLVLEGFSANSARFEAGAGLVLSDGAVSETLALEGNFATGDFAVANDAAGTAVTLDAPAPCFCAGTRIATVRGNVVVEELLVGDEVRTAGGFQPVRWIGRRSYERRFIAGNHLALPVRIRQHALGFNVPSRDLFVSPDHALAEGGVLVHAWRLVNGVSITQAQSVARVDYFHVELDRHAVIFAENTPVESFLDEGCRNRFANAPSAPADLAPQKPCLPRVEDGYYLARLKARIDARAGIAASHVAPGMLRGCVDETGPLLRGWAQDAAAPEAPVELELLCAGRPVMRFLANRFRADLRRAGLGSGCHAFELRLPALEGALSLRRVTDGTPLGADVQWKAA